MTRRRFLRIAGFGAMVVGMVGGCTDDDGSRVRGDPGGDGGDGSPTVSSSDA